MAGTGDAHKDMEAHRATYSGFLTLLKVSLVATLAVTALVIVLIA